MEEFGRFFGNPLAQVAIAMLAVVAGVVLLLRMQAAPLVGLICLAIFCVFISLALWQTPIADSKIKVGIIVIVVGMCIAVTHFLWPEAESVKLADAPKPEPTHKLSLTAEVLPYLALSNQGINWMTALDVGPVGAPLVRGIEIPVPDIDPGRRLTKAERTARERARDSMVAKVAMLCTIRNDGPDRITNIELMLHLSWGDLLPEDPAFPMIISYGNWQPFVDWLLTIPAAIGPGETFSFRIVSANAAHAVTIAFPDTAMFSIEETTDRLSSPVAKQIAGSPCLPPGSQEPDRAIKRMSGHH